MLSISAGSGSSSGRCAHVLDAEANARDFQAAQLPPPSRVRRRTTGARCLRKARALAPPSSETPARLPAMPRNRDAPFRICARYSCAVVLLIAGTEFWHELPFSNTRCVVRLTVGPLPRFGGQLRHVKSRLPGIGPAPAVPSGRKSKIRSLAGSWRARSAGPTIRVAGPGEVDPVACAIRATA